MGKEIDNVDPKYQSDSRNQDEGCRETTQNFEDSRDKVRGDYHNPNNGYSPINDGNQRTESDH